MVGQGNTFSVRSQIVIMWWGIGLAIAYTLAYVFLLQQLPLKDPAWAPEQVASWYVQNQTKVKLGAVINGWTGAFLLPILTVLVVQMARVEIGGWKIWSALSLVSGALTSLFLMLAPIFFGVAAYTAPRRNPEVTTLMHELASLTMVTTDQPYIFLWIAVTVTALRPATQSVRHNPFPRWWGYTSLWIAVMFEAGACGFIPRSGPLAWNGLLVFWSPVVLFGVWLTIQCWLIFRALRGQLQQTESESAPAADAAEILTA